MLATKQKPRDPRLIKGWKEWDAIADAVDGVKKNGGFGEVNILITNANVTYIEQIYRKKVE